MASFAAPRLSYASGFARRRAESEFPNLWNGLCAAYMPCMGQSGSRIPNLAGGGGHMEAAGGFAYLGNGIMGYQVGGYSSNFSSTWANCAAFRQPYPTIVLQMAWCNQQGVSGTLMGAGANAWDGWYLGHDSSMLYNFTWNTAGGRDAVGTMWLGGLASSNCKVPVTVVLRYDGKTAAVDAFDASGKLVSTYSKAATYPGPITYGSSVGGIFSGNTGGWTGLLCYNHPLSLNELRQLTSVSRYVNISPIAAPFIPARGPLGLGSGGSSSSKLWLWARTNRRAILLG